MKNNKFRVGELVTCVKIDWTNNNLITVGQEYEVLEISDSINTISIMTDVWVECHISYSDEFFIGKREIRKNKINKLNEISGNR